jgi:hypothetical protein
VAAFQTLEGSDAVADTSVGFVPEFVLEGEVFRTVSAAAGTTLYLWEGAWEDLQGKPTTGVRLLALTGAMLSPPPYRGHLPCA